jgi:transcriptional regulator with XRE-family HTH domain
MGKPANDPPFNHLRAWREFRQLTQEQLAEKVGTAGNVISLLESGERGLSHKWLLKLAPVLGTTPGYLLDHDPNDLDSDIVRTVLALPENVRAKAMAVLKALAN